MTIDEIIDKLVDIILAGIVIAAICLFWYVVGLIVYEIFIKGG